MTHALRTPTLTETFQLPGGRQGVLPNQLLRAAIADGIIHAGGFTIPQRNIQPASLDLRLGEVAYRIQCSFLPGTETVDRRVKDFVIDEIDLHKEGAVLETNRPYLIPLKESLSLPPNVRGKANPFDEIAAGYQGGLYLEIVPLSFPVRVREDLSLNQLRLAVGRVALTDEEVRAEHERSPILFLNDLPVPSDHLDLAHGLFLGLDLRGRDGGRVGYRARESAPLLDMTKTGQTDPYPYWESVRREVGDRIVLSPRNFYLLMSNEAVRIPPTLAAEMTAYDPTSGELRTHYAGFFDPGFGYDAAGDLHGSTAALEVRAHDVPFMVEHQQKVCKLTFERMLDEPTSLYGQGIGSNYQGQTETLGKHFRRAPDAQLPSNVKSDDGAGAAHLGQLDMLAPD